VPLAGEPERASVLVIDDTPDNLRVIGELLHPHYRVQVAKTGRRGLEIATSLPQPDLILLDVMMPEMDGYAVLTELQSNPATRAIPVIFVTAMDSLDDELRGLSLGAVDYIARPLRPPIVLSRIRTHVELKRARDWLCHHNALLEAEVARRMRENELIQDNCIRALARLAEMRDQETGNHLRRTQNYVRILACQLSSHPRYAEFLTEQRIELIAKSAPLHDIGKVGIPDQILLKPGPLSPNEWMVMKTHTVLGKEAIEQAQRDVELPLEFLTLSKEIAHYHHERWNGRGYPAGLAEQQIPLPARLMAVADVFDALISWRVYKAPIPFAQARDMIMEERGQHFDPDITDAFFATYDQLKLEAERYADREEAVIAHVAKARQAEFAGQA